MVKQFINSIEGVEEAVENIPLVTILGTRSVSVENFLNIVEYGQETIRLKTKLGQIVIEGKGLFAKSMNQEEIVIKGKIENLSFIK
ncbi:MAG: hypothetical protein ATN33_07115 [Epulopiscium sp. Nele67-Bin001]|nr:MAG: hypothetical protein BEN18_00055 [Epulopiscium sp. Nuni2H_MBin001]OON92560.1 MAG: hypothetical protein ATN33_07115 [Epulopiscium sp. Nele67-Bin001]